MSVEEKGENEMTLYMAVTSDKFELSIVVKTSLQMLSEKCHVSPSTVLTSIRRKQSGKQRGCKFLRIEVDE